MQEAVQKYSGFYLEKRHTYSDHMKMMSTLLRNFSGALCSKDYDKEQYNLCYF